MAESGLLIVAAVGALIVILLVVMIFMMRSESLKNIQSVDDQAKRRLQDLERRVNNLYQMLQPHPNETRRAEREVHQDFSPYSRASSPTNLSHRDAVPQPPLEEIKARVPETYDELLHLARQALGSPAQFAAFTRLIPVGVGYVLDAAGHISMPQLLSPGESPDKADLWVFSYPDKKIVLPAFNLRRNIALYAADAGRPAEARLGWLFNIVAGDDIYAQAAAEANSDDWGVIKKGRLFLPL